MTMHAVECFACEGTGMCPGGAYEETCYLCCGCGERCAECGQGTDWCDCEADEEDDR